MSKGIYEHPSRHGHAGGYLRSYPPTPTYNSWNAMRDRCLNPNHKAYPRYGGRGIQVCPEWATFQGFLKDMGERPGPEYSLSRLDHDKGYFPDNVIWDLRKNNDLDSLPRARNAKTKKN